MNTLDILSTDKPPLKARYLNRTPDAGVCTILSIDWEERRITMSNGHYTYFPSFDEIEMVDDSVDKPDVESITGFPWLDDVIKKEDVLKSDSDLLFTYYERVGRGSNYL